MTKPDVKTIGNKNKGYTTNLYVNGEAVAVGWAKTRPESIQKATNMFLSLEVMKSLPGLTP